MTEGIGAVGCEWPQNLIFCISSCYLPRVVSNLGFVCIFLDFHLAQAVAQRIDNLHAVFRPSDNSTVI